VRLYAVADLLEELAPIRLAADWDNPGWQVQLEDGELQGILVSMEATPAVIEEARAAGANLVITHHPLLFAGLRRLDTGSLVGSTTLAAVRAHVSVLSLHTNLDAAPGGTSWALAEALGLQGLRVLEQGSLPEVGFGVLARAPMPRTLADWAIVARDRLASSPLAVSGDLDESHEIIAVMGGSGAGQLDCATASGASLYLTADIRYHEAQKAQAAGLSLVVVDHFDSERPVLTRVAAFLEPTVPCPVSLSSCRTTPWEAERP
jgi:dinuclear metal center YbgI/SA1388 family protein